MPRSATRTKGVVLLQRYGGGRPLVTLRQQAADRETGGFLMSGTTALRRAGVRVAAATLALLTAPVAAQAAAPAASEPTPAARAQRANSCDGGGSFRGSGDNHLSNGVLSAGFCRYPADGVGTVNIEYHKSRGAPITVQFAWEWVDTRGANPTGRQYDNGSFSAVHPRRAHLRQRHLQHPDRVLMRLVGDPVGWHATRPPHPPQHRQ